MTAGEFAFLAIGLLLGVGVGSAAIQVFRSRPPAHQVRVTVAPNSIPSRRSATLSESAPVDEMTGPARGGPADRRNADRIPSSEDHERAGVGIPTMGGDRRLRIGRQRTPVLSPAGIERVAIHPSGIEPVSPARLAAAVGIPITPEPDPEMDFLRALASRREKVGAGAGSLATGDARGLGAGGEEAAGRRVDATGSDGPIGSLGGGSGEGPPGGGSNGGPPGPATEGPDGGTGAAASAVAVAPIVAAAPAIEHTSPQAGGPAASDSSDPCSEARRLADERCALSARARDGAREAVEAMRAAQRSYDDLIGRSEEAAAAADPRAVRTAKETAQHAFREARGAATTRDAVEAAAREWLSEINRINRQTREAIATADRDRAAATDLAATLDRLAVEADAARIAAETAEEACVAAREAVATCQEAAAVASSGARAARAGAATQDPEPTATPMGSRAGEDAAIIRLLRGDRDVLTRMVATLGGDDEQERRRWRSLITSLLDALIGRSIEASAFDFPIEHPFWGMFNRDQSREITAALSSLGFRHDGFGGWVDGRVPGQRDLSLATGYAGLDPMRIRHWPTDAELESLMSEVTVAADEYVWDAAGGLTLGELVSLLGRRADALTELWNDWGTVRPLLLAVD